MVDFNQIINDFAAGQLSALSAGWADQRLAQIHHMLEALADEMPNGSTEQGQIGVARKAVALADQYIEKRQRENT